jgi:hypothetical protein
VQASVVKVELWFGNRLGLATLRTILTHVDNMMVSAGNIRQRVVVNGSDT